MHEPATPPSRGADSTLYHVGDLSIDSGRQRVTRGGDPIALPRLSYDLLLVLIQHAPNLVANDRLMEKVWPKIVVSPETLSQRVKLLRDALGDDPRNPRYVEGLRGRGYRLIPPVEFGAPPSSEERVEPSGGTPSEASMASGAAPAAPAPAAPAPAAPRPRQPRSRLRWPMAAVPACVVVAALGVHFLKKPEPAKAPSSVEVVAVRPRAVAVLPFDNLGGEPANEYIGLGIAETVLNRLGGIRELIVIARSSSFSLGKPRPDAHEVGAKLGVGYLVEGSVQRAGNKLRVNAQLVDTARNIEIWSLSFDRAIDDVFAVQDEIAQRVAEKLEVSIAKPSVEFARYGTEAYLAFLRGRSLLESRKIPDVEASIQQFTRALQLAPTFAAAMVDLAYAKLQLDSLRNTFNRNKGRLLPEIEALVNRAIELDPTAGAPYYLRAQIKFGTNSAAGAEADFRKGYELAPNYALGVYNYGGFLFGQERLEEALALVDRASLLDPLAPSTYYLRGEILRQGFGRREEAAASYQQAIAVAPQFYPAYTRLALVRFNEGNVAEAARLGEKSIAIEPKVGWTRSRLIWFYVHLGDLDAARDVEQGYVAGDSLAPFSEALICYRGGHLERAEQLTRRALLDPDVEIGEVTFTLMTEAIVERSLARHAPGTARDFILAIPGLKKEHGRLAVVDDNWPYFVTLAALEQGAGNSGAAAELAQETLNFLDKNKPAGAPGVHDWTRASALAVLGRNEEALVSLEKMNLTGNHMRWWVTLQSDPSFTALHSSPRFQALARDNQAWLTAQQAVLEQMRQGGEIPRRAAAAAANGC